MKNIILLGTAIINKYERKRKQQIIGSTRRLNKTRTSCLSDKNTNKIPQTNIVSGPSNVFKI